MTYRMSYAYQHPASHDVWTTEFGLIYILYMVGFRILDVYSFVFSILLYYYHIKKIVYLTYSIYICIYRRSDAAHR